jgi:hypothetical protein
MVRLRQPKRTECTCLWLRSILRFLIAAVALKAVTGSNKLDEGSAFSQGLLCSPLLANILHPTSTNSHTAIAFKTSHWNIASLPSPPISLNSLHSHVAESEFEPKSTHRLTRGLKATHLQSLPGTRRHGPIRHVDHALRQNWRRQQIKTIESIEACRNTAVPYPEIPCRKVAEYTTGFGFG